LSMTGAGASAQAAPAKSAGVAQTAASAATAKVLVIGDPQKAAEI
jgi:hypothetical protein